MLGTHGRLDDMLIIKGVNIFPSDVEAVVRALAGFNGEYRLVVEREQHLDLRVEAERTGRQPARRWRTGGATGAPAESRHRRVGRSGGAGARHLPRATHKAKRVEDRRQQVW